MVVVVVLLVLLLFVVVVVSGKIKSETRMTASILKQDPNA